MVCAFLVGAYAFLIGMYALLVRVYGLLLGVYGLVVGVYALLAGGACSLSRGVCYSNLVGQSEKISLCREYDVNKYLRYGVIRCTIALSLLHTK